MGWSFDGSWFYPTKYSGKALYNIDEWHPTRNIAQAWELLEKVKENLPEISYESGNWYCGFEFQTYKHTGQMAPTAPEAITRACLKAGGVEIE